MPGISKGLTQAYELRDLTSNAAKSYAEALTVDGKLKVSNKDDANGIAALVRAWESCDERVRIHRGKPLPGSLRPSGKPKRGRGSVVQEPVEPSQPSVVSPSSASHLTPQAPPVTDTEA